MIIIIIMIFFSVLLKLLPLFSLLVPVKLLLVCYINTIQYYTYSQK